MKVSCRPRPASIEFQATCQPDTLRSCIVKKFFEGISLSSIVAGTLAAVTSFLLASKIGIGGSVIGAAASYVVSTVATKIYQNVLTASGEKLQSASSSGNGITKDAENGDADGGAPRTAGSRTDVRDEPDTATGVTADDASSTHRPREIVFSRANGRTYSVDELRKSRFRASKHTAMIVTLVSGLLAVAVTAGVVMLATQGRGTDNLVSPTTTTPARNDTGTRTGTPDQNNTLPQTGTGDDSKGTSKDSKTDAPSTDLDANGTSGSTGAGASDSKTDGTANGSNGTGTSKNPTTEDPTSQGAGGSQTGSNGTGTGSTKKDPSGSTSTSTDTSGTSGSPATGQDAGAGSTGK